MSSGRKPILVFDLDETLIASEILYNTSSSAYILNKITVNHRLLEVIHMAKEMGCKILLLTNNDNAKVLFNGEEGKFVDIALNELTKAYLAKYSPSRADPLFNRVLSAEKIKSMKRTYLKKRIDTHYKDISGRNEIRYYAKPVKSLKDVSTMLGYPVKGGDVYFFDDDNQHQLCTESNFIHITPPFGKGDDKTNFSLIDRIKGDKSRRRGPKRGEKTRRKLKE